MVKRKKKKTILFSASAARKGSIFSLYLRQEEKVSWFPEGSLGLGTPTTVLEGKCKRLPGATSCSASVFLPGQRKVIKKGGNWAGGTAQ